MSYGDLCDLDINLDATEPGEVIYEGPGLVIRVPDPKHPVDVVSHWRFIQDRGIICLRCSEFSIPGNSIDLADILDHQVRAHGYVRVADPPITPVPSTSE